MSATSTDTDAGADAGDGPTWDAARIVSVVGAVLVAVALAVGAFLIGDPGRSKIDDPAAYVKSFYERGDVAGLLAALAPGSIPEEQLAQAERDLEQLLRPEIEVVNTRELQFEGKEFTEVTTRDRLIWCVDGSGTLYVQCRLGQATVDVFPGDQPLEATVSRVDVFPDRVELVVGLTATGGETVTFGEGVELQGTDAAEDAVQLVQTVATVGGQLAAVQLSQYQLSEQGTLFLVWRGPQDAIVGRTLTVAWDGGSIELDVAEADLYS
ncbi:MAG: hypothetical protein R3343_04075 [Nitriliruptorales bacterium]|nr:hypothetical protein [Nitriliruptorales bacterium]